MNIYWGMKKLWILQNWTFFSFFFFFFLGGGGVISVHFKAFLTVKVQIGIIFGVAKKSNILWGMPKFLIFCE